MTDWKAGDKAIWVGSTAPSYNGIPFPLSVDVIYTVARVYEARGRDRKGISRVAICLELVEVEPTDLYALRAMGFVKPPSETHFKHLLTDAPRESEVA